MFQEHQFSNKNQKVPIMLNFMNSKVPDDWQISDKQYHIFQKSKSYEISNIDIYIAEDLEFIIHVIYCCIQLEKKASNLIKVISSYNICSGIKVNKQKNHLSFSSKNLIFSELLCSISSSHFRPFNFMCTFN